MRIFATLFLSLVQNKKNKITFAVGFYLIIKITHKYSFKLVNAYFFFFHCLIPYLRMINVIMKIYCHFFYTIFDMNYFMLKFITTTLTK